MAGNKTDNGAKGRIEKALSKKLGVGVVKDVSNASANIKHWFTTGIPALDVILSGEVGKGFPSGRICELYGEEQVGKTTLMVKYVENKFDEDYIQTLGIYASMAFVLNCII